VSHREVPSELPNTAATREISTAPEAPPDSRARPSVGVVTYNRHASAPAVRCPVGEVCRVPQRKAEGQECLGERAVHAHDRLGSAVGCPSLAGVSVGTPAGRRLRVGRTRSPLFPSAHSKSRLTRRAATEVPESRADQVRRTFRYSELYGTANEHRSGWTNDLIPV
jgi:hypothetical protein